jgi:hypothetical protein
VKKTNKGKGNKAGKKKVGRHTREKIKKGYILRILLNILHIQFK